jgi:AAA domain/CHC2 zinc finger
MSSDIAEAKRRLPLPMLMQQVGSGEHAKKSTKCPFHADKHNSFSISQANGSWRWKCFTECGSGDEIDFLARHKSISKHEAIKLFLEMADVAQTRAAVPAQKSNSENRTLIDWQRCLNGFTAKHLERVSEWRGYSGEFCSWLHTAGLVGLWRKRVAGLWQDHIAFPVRDRGKIVGVHYFQKDDTSWRYYPLGAKVRPLVIGELIAGESVHVFESQWDAFAFMDVSRERSGIIITRGASNGALVTGLIPKDSTVYVWTQNDPAGDKWQRDICANKKATVKRARIPTPHKDLNDWTRAGATADDLANAMAQAEVIREQEKPLIEFRSPLQLKNFIPTPGLVLVGDCHIVRGSVFVIGGTPGVGKSRASVTLAVAGATRSDWFGLNVHRTFKVMIIQTENGEFRLSKEFRELDCATLEDYIRVCPPPPYGLCFQRDEFRAQLAAAIADFKPDIVIYDPWNAAARDEKAREYLETFDALRSVLPVGDDAPALGIVAHTRKPKTDERASGRALLNLLAGSYVLGSVPRTVFVMQAASDDTTDNRVVWTCCKNNDGEPGERSAWERRNGLFARVSEFEWDTFDNPHKDERVTITADDIAEIFENGQKQFTKAEAVKALRILTEAGRTVCYDALKLDGRFATHLRETDGLLSWKA